MLHPCGWNLDFDALTYAFRLLRSEFNPVYRILIKPLKIHINQFCWGISFCLDIKVPWSAPISFVGRYHFILQVEGCYLWCPMPLSKHVTHVHMPIGCRQFLLCNFIVLNSFFFFLINLFWIDQIRIFFFPSHVSMLPYDRSTLFVTSQYFLIFYFWDFFNY